MASLISLLRVERRYEATLDEPLVDKATGVKVYVHSVCPYLASSVETVFHLFPVKPAISALFIALVRLKSLLPVKGMRMFAGMSSL